MDPSSLCSRHLFAFVVILGIVASLIQSRNSETCIDRALYSQDQMRGHDAMVEHAEYNVITKTVILNQGSPDEARSNIRQYFKDTFDIDSSLFDHIKPEHLWSRADPLRHPVCWYAAHTATFFINKLRVSQAIKHPLNHQFESTFAVGVDEMSWDDKLEDRSDWPAPSEVFKYRQQVRDAVLNIIDTQPLSLPIEWNSVFWAILMGIEHERIHIETSSVLIRQLPVNVFFTQSEKELNTPWDNTCKVGAFSNTKDDVISFKPDLGAPGHAVQNELIPVQGKYVTYGRKIDDFSHNLAVYGWDNEYGEMAVDVPDFNASKYLVSNEEYYEFVIDGGYKTKEYWTDEGWRWVQSTKTKMPKFWVKKGHKFYLRNMLNEIELPWNWPVIANHLEGLAFTKWKSQQMGKNIRLLTEDEWHVLRQLGEYGEIDQPHWKMAPGNINLEYYASECPVDMFEFGQTGFYDVIGNVWQHTLTPQHPFDGFEVHAIYDDFTVPCFGPHHNIIKGGSWISTGNEAIALSRYQFRRHFFQHAGIRYVESDRDLSYLNELADRNPYDDDDMVNLYTHFGFANEEYLNIPNYPKRIAQIALNATQNKKLRALDVGCSTGRTAFELAKDFETVIGIDFTVRLIGVGYRMQENAALEWTLPEQGEITKQYKVSAKELGFEKTMSRVTFVQNDAQNMDKQYGNFDVIIASNLIDRLSNPGLFLEHIHERAVIGGILLLCDPYSWELKHTPRMHWIGGNVDEMTHKAEYSEDAVRKLLLAKRHWQLMEEMDVPLVMKMNKRSYQVEQSHCMIFKRI